MKKRTRNLIYKGLLFLVAVFFCFNPVNGGSDIGSRLIVNAIGIDGGGSVHVTVETLGDENQAIIGDGDSLTLALDHINTKQGLYVEMAHCGLVVLGKELTTKETVNVLMSLLGDGKINAGVSVVVAEGTAEEFISRAIKLPGSNGVSEYLSYIDKYVHIGVEKLITFLDKLNSKSAAACLPVISAVKQEGETGGGSGSNSSEAAGAASKEVGDEKAEMNLLRQVKVYGEKETVLDTAATRGYDWLSNLTESGLVSLEDFVYEGVSYGPVAADIEKKKGSIKIVGADRAQMVLDIRLHAENRNRLISAYMDNKAKMRDVYAELEHQFTESVRRDAQALVDFCKAEQTDILGLCSQMHKYRPKDVKPPSETLSRVTVEVTPKVTVY